MNPVLLRAVRERMAGETTERLLEVWVANDRATYSPEAFEAVKSILAERGHANLPPQNAAPAPVAPAADRVATSEDRYWLGWLRPALWAGIALAAVGLYRGVRVVSAWVGSGADWRDGTWDTFVRLAHFAGLPLLLMVGSVAALRLVPWSRTVLLVYAWVSVADAVWQVVSHPPIVTGDSAATALELATYALVYAKELALAVILLVILRRPPVVALFAAPEHSGGQISLDI
jgi:hypothetical protein